MLMTSTELLEIADKNQKKLDADVAKFLAKGGQVQSFEKKDHDQAQRDFRKAKRLRNESYRQAALARL